MITQYIRFLYENDVTFAEMLILLHISNNVTDDDFYSYVALFDNREENYVYDRININIVFDLLSRAMIELVNKKSTFTNKLSLTVNDISKTYILTTKGKATVKSFLDLDKDMIAKHTNFTQKDNPTLLDKISSYWYDDRNVPYKTTSIGDNVAVAQAFKEFRKENPNYSDELIVKAVYIYFDEYKKRNGKSEDNMVNYNFLTSRLDFITSNKPTSLKSFCEANKNSNVLLSDMIISLD